MDLFSLIDGHWIDISSICTGFLFIAYKRHRLSHHTSEHAYPLFSKNTGIDFGSGVALFPLIVLVFSAISSKVLYHLAESSPVTLAVAGIYGILAILEGEPPPQVNELKKLG